MIDDDGEVTVFFYFSFFLKFLISNIDQFPLSILPDLPSLFYR